MRARGTMELAMIPFVFLPLLPLLLSQFYSTLSIDLPSHGCYWTESCQSKWLGGCGVGHVMVDQSDNCNGLCSDLAYPACLPFHTHFRCCKPEIPRATERCAKCRKKVDFGDEYICCTDCSEPYLIDKSSKMGFCKTGAELAVQLKPQENFKWVSGPWMKCSSPCDGGVRYRDVGCFGSIEDDSIRHYPVDDSMCSAEEMPARQESCNIISCGDYSDRNESTGKQSAKSGWFITLLALLGLAAGLGFAGYTFYKRRTSTPTGFVYIMLEGYS